MKKVTALELKILHFKWVAKYSRDKKQKKVEHKFFM